MSDLEIGDIFKLVWSDQYSNYKDITSVYEYEIIEKNQVKVVGYDIIHYIEKPEDLRVIQTNQLRDKFTIKVVDPKLEYYL